jgi:hypothetical protein
VYPDKLGLMARGCDNPLCGPACRVSQEALINDWINDGMIITGGETPGEECSYVPLRSQRISHEILPRSNPKMPL